MEINDTMEEDSNKNDNNDDEIIRIHSKHTDDNNDDDDDDNRGKRKDDINFVQHGHHTFVTAMKTNTNDYYNNDWNENNANTTPNMTNTKQSTTSRQVPRGASQLVTLFGDVDDDDNSNNSNNNNSNDNEEKDNNKCIRTETERISPPSLSPLQPIQLSSTTLHPQLKEAATKRAQENHRSTSTTTSSSFRRKTFKITNKFSGNNSNRATFDNNNENDAHEIIYDRNTNESDHLLHDFNNVGTRTKEKPKYHYDTTGSYNNDNNNKKKNHNLKSMFQQPNQDQDNDNDNQKVQSHFTNPTTTTTNDTSLSNKNHGCSLPNKESMINTIAASIIFGLFHIVFCLAQASAITRPYSHRPVMGSMVRIASMGTILTTPFYLRLLLKSFPDVYPSIDSFTAPFYVQQVIIIDQVLTDDGMDQDDNLFLTTFCVVSGIGLLLTGLLLVGATKFKLANLGAFLPYPVMAGFFSTVGVLLWTLAFVVDTGKHVGEVFIHSFHDIDQMKQSILHHVGSIIVAILIKRIGTIQTSFIPIVTILIIPTSYIILFLTGISLEEARQMGWFWYSRDFHTPVGKIQDWSPPLPFGVLLNICYGNVHWGAVMKALPITLAMSLIYFIRCSLHAPALKKNAENIQKWRDDQDKNSSNADFDLVNRRSSFRMARQSSEFEDEFFMSVYATENERATETLHPMKMPEIYSIYGRMLILSGIAGGSAILPSLGPASTIVQLGAIGASPQFGSALVLLAFYLTDFELLGFIPKITFSSLLVLAAFTMIQDWFLKSYSKIKQKGEWAVVPMITILSFTVGALPSVFIGIAMSTFIFVGAFYRTGVVKYIANGLTVHSTTERSPEDTKWLDQHGDLIQLVVLQNYMFFGNAYSCLTYIQSMFDEPIDSDLEYDFELPPIPKFIIIDFTLVSGMDASAVDVFADIIALSKEHSCKVFLCGLRSDFKSILSCGGVKPSRKKNSMYYMLSFHIDMDTALRRAEDALLVTVMKDEEKEMRRRANSIKISIQDGFMNALTLIDFQVSNIDVTFS